MKERFVILRYSKYDQSDTPMKIQDVPKFLRVRTMNLAPERKVHMLNWLIKEIKKELDNGS